MHSRVDHVIEEVAEHVHADASLELILLRQTQVHVEFPTGHLAITDRCDTARQELVLSDRQLAKVLLRLVLEVEVGSVMTDLHSVDAGEDVARGVGQLTRQLAVCISEELSTGGVRCARIDAVLVESERVDDAAVTARVHEVDLAISGDLVELFLERMTPFDQVAMLVAVSANQDTRRSCKCRFLKQRNDSGDRVGLLRTAVHPAEHLPVHQRVCVRIDESRHHGSAVEFDNCGRSTAQSPSLSPAVLERSYCGKAVSEHQERVGSGRVVVNSVNRGAGEDGGSGVERRGFVRVQLAHGGGSFVEMVVRSWVVHVVGGAAHYLMSENYAPTWSDAIHQSFRPCGPQLFVPIYDHFRTYPRHRRPHANVLIGSSDRKISGKVGTP